MAITANELNIILTANDKDFQKKLKAAERRTQFFKNKAEKDLGKVTKSFNGMAAAAKNFLPAIGAAAAVTGLKNIMMQAGDTAKEIQKLSTLSGIGVERFQELAFAARQVGVDQEKLADILKDVDDKMGDFLTTGAGPLKDFFEQIAPLVGITEEAFKGLSSEQALGLYVSKLQEAGVNQQQMTFFMEAIASDATLLAPLLLNNAKALDTMSESARDLGVVLSEDMVNQTAHLEDEFNQMMESMGSKFTTFAMTVANGFNQLFNITDNAKRNDVVDELNRLESLQKKTVDKMAKLAAGNSFSKDTQISRLSEMSVALGAEIMEQEKLLSNLDASIASRSVKVAPLSGKGVNTGGGNSKSSFGKGPNFGLRDGEIANSGAINAALAAIQKIADSDLNLARSRIKNASDTADAQIKSEKDRVNLIAGQLRNFAKIEKDAAGKIKDEKDKAAAEEAERLAKGVKGQVDAVRELTPEFMRLDSAIKSVENNLDSMLMNLVDGTSSVKDSFKSMAAAIIKDLYRIYVVQQITGMIGGMITNATVGSLQGPTMSGATLDTRASGGPVSGGSPYLVGEKGPELMVPRTSGMVVPNHALGGGDSISVHQTINVSTGVQQTVRTEIKSLMPQIADSAKAAVADARRRGGASGRAFS